VQKAGLQTKKAQAAILETGKHQADARREPDASMAKQAQSSKVSGVMSRASVQR